MKENLKYIINLVILLLAIVFFMMLFISPNVEPEEKFKVVDTYDECKVVQYAPPKDAKYHYFLDCRK